MIKIKLRPVGKRGQRQYRIVVANDREKLTGTILEYLGSYDPRSTDNKISVNYPLYQSWLTKGAQPTQTVKALVAKHNK